MDAWEPVVFDAWRRGQQLSAVGPGDVGVHFTHARHYEALIEGSAASGIDLGTGAGIPGLALAGFRPLMRWTLVDAALRRCNLLRDAVEAAGWQDRVAVIHGRAEDLARDPAFRQGFDVVTARLFGPPPVTLECAAPFVRPGGQVVVSDLPIEEIPGGLEQRWPQPGLDPLGLRRSERREAPALQVFAATGRLEDRFPRKSGVASKRPLWPMSSP